MVSVRAMFPPRSLLMMMVSSPKRAAYIAAVKPAGPAPMMSTSQVLFSYSPPRVRILQG